jgi:hypothetical protein
MKGFEPSTPALRTRCSPAELHPHAVRQTSTPIILVSRRKPAAGIHEKQQAYKAADQGYEPAKKALGRIK